LVAWLEPRRSGWPRENRDRRGRYDWYIFAGGAVKAKRTSRRIAFFVRLRRRPLWVQCLFGKLSPHPRPLSPQAGRGEEMQQRRCLLPSPRLRGEGSGVRGGTFSNKISIFPAQLPNEQVAELHLLIQAHKSDAPARGDVRQAFFVDHLLVVQEHRNLTALHANMETVPLPQ
jgi:hypothetical protein